MSYVHLNARERMSIFYLHGYGLSLREIGRRLNRSHATISRGLERTIVSLAGIVTVLLKLMLRRAKHYLDIKGATIKQDYASAL